MLRRVHVLREQVGHGGRKYPDLRRAVLDMGEVVYAETDRDPEYGDLVEVTLHSGEMVTVVGTIEDLFRGIVEVESG